MHKLVEAMLHSGVNWPGRSTTTKEFVFCKTERILNASYLNKNAAGALEGEMSLKLEVQSPYFFYITGTLHDQNFESLRKYFTYCCNPTNFLITLSFFVAWSAEQFYFMFYRFESV